MITDLLSIFGKVLLWALIALIVLLGIRETILLLIRKIKEVKKCKN